jgi:hypothetical protein
MTLTLKNKGVRGKAQVVESACLARAKPWFNPQYYPAAKKEKEMG